MSIEKFTTEALVLAEYERGESDAMLLLYTRDFGVISAKQSSLKKSAKLRQHLLVGRYTDVTVVKGREFYRVAGARESLVKLSTESTSHISGVVKRFLGFENKNSKLYDRLKSYITKENLDPNIVKLCALADILVVGGYLDVSKIDMSLVEYKNSTADDLYVKIVLHKDTTVKNLRDAVEGSML